MAGIMDTCTVNSVKPASDDLLIVSPLGSSRIYIYSISTGKYSELYLSGTSILCFEVNQVTGDVVALVEVRPDILSQEETENQLKILILVEENGSLVEEDRLDVFPKAKTVSFIGSTNYILVEGKPCLSR
jgi:hypothetical protein